VNVLPSCVIVLRVLVYVGKGECLAIVCHRPESACVCRQRLAIVCHCPESACVCRQR